jgi:hypothetical protein
VKWAGKYVVDSKTIGRRFGTYDTLAEAKKQLREVEFLEHRPRRRRAAGRAPDGKGAG